MTHVAGKLHLVLITIRDHYDAALEPVRRAPGSQISGALVAGPIPISAQIMDIRAQCRARLAHWVIFVVKGRDLHTEKLSFLDVAAMVEMLTRHTDWLGDQPEGDLALDALHRSAHALTSIAVPERREWMPLGPCPLEVEHDDELVEVDGELVRIHVVATPCPGTIRAYPTCDPYCDSCEVQAVVPWWEQQMFGDPLEHNVLTAAELVVVIHHELGQVYTEAAIRQWDHRGHIRNLGKNEAGRNLYHRVDVILFLTERQGSVA